MNDAKGHGVGYVLDNQVGFKLRLANQKHLEIFARELPEVTPTQFGVLARLNEIGEASQNHLGRLVGLDGATIKGVVSRLTVKGFVSVSPSQKDRRRLMITLSSEGAEFLSGALNRAMRISTLTTANLTKSECEILKNLLEKL